MHIFLLRFGSYLNKRISLSEHELFPNTFINFQLLHYKIVTDNVIKLIKLPNHKLFRIDNIYLYPSVREQINLRYLGTGGNVMINRKKTLIEALCHFHTIMEYF